MIGKKRVAAAGGRRPVWEVARPRERAAQVCVEEKGKVDVGPPPRASSFSPLSLHLFISPVVLVFSSYSFSSFCLSIDVLPLPFSFCWPTVNVRERVVVLRIVSSLFALSTMFCRRIDGIGSEEEEGEEVKWVDDA